MTSEQNVPEVQSHQGSAVAPIQEGDSQYLGGSVAPGMGQSKSSRRRRRKRKNKMDAATSVPAPGEQQGQIPSVQASAQPAGQPSQNGGQQQGPGGAKRWKKKFRDRDRQRNSQNPGNTAEGGFRETHQPGNTTFKRSKGGKQRTPRGFVGPMDHSYREVNGNFADGPP